MQLVKAHAAAPHAYSIADMFSLPFNTYFIDRESTVLDINERAAAVCGYVSRKEAMGRSLRDVSARNTAQQILYNDQIIMSRKKIKITEEIYTRLDDTELVAISIKFPWLVADKLVGIFGCSIMVEDNHLADLSAAIILLMQTGLLVPDSMTTILPGYIYANRYLNQRDIEIIYWVVRGKTAKEIALNLHLSHRTIEHRLDKIKLKLGVSSKAALIEKIINHCK